MFTLTQSCSVISPQVAFRQIDLTDDVGLDFRFASDCFISHSAAKVNGRSLCGVTSCQSAVGLRMTELLSPPCDSFLLAPVPVLFHQAADELDSLDELLQADASC